MIPVNTKAILVSFDIASIIICLLLQSDFGSHTVKIKSFDKKIFNKLVLATELILITDALSWIVIGLENYVVISYLVLSIYFSLHLYMCTIWIMYCDFQINQDKAHTIKIRNILLIPTTIVTIISFMSYKYPTVYNLTSDNTYHRGDYYSYFIGLCFLYLAYSVYLASKKILFYKKHNYTSEKLLILIIYPILPVAGTIIQTLFFGLNITWILITISLIIVYFNFQNTLLMIDPLTKISNRYRFDTFLDKHFYDESFNKIKFIAIIDLNKFKNINDEYGHLEGDKVLKIVSEILTKIANKDDIVARLGGDEFVIFGERETIDTIEKIKTDINFEIDKHNQYSNNKYIISLSIGFSVQNKNNSKSKKQMFIEADESMYKEKRKSRDRK